MAKGLVEVQYSKRGEKWMQYTQGIPAGEGIYDTKSRAVTEGRNLAKRHGATLKVYKKSGGLQKTTDYSNGNSSSGSSRSGGIGDMLGL